MIVGSMTSGLLWGFGGEAFNLSDVHKIRTIASCNGNLVECVFILRYVSLILNKCKSSPEHILNRYVLKNIN